MCEPTCQRSDTPSLELSDHSTVPFLVNWKPRISQLFPLKRQYRKVNWEHALEIVATLNWLHLRCQIAHLHLRITTRPLIWHQTTALSQHRQKTNPSGPFGFIETSKEHFRKIIFIFKDFVLLPLHINDCTEISCQWFFWLIKLSRLSLCRLQRTSSHLLHSRPA